MQIQAALVTHLLVSASLRLPERAKRVAADGAATCPAGAVAPAVLLSRFLRTRLTTGGRRTNAVCQPPCLRLGSAFVSSDLRIFAFTVGSSQRDSEDCPH